MVINPTKRKTFYILTIIDGVVLLFSLMTKKGSLLTMLITFLIIMSILNSIVWIIVGSLKKCTYCGEMFAMTKISSQLLNTSQSTMTVRNRVRNSYGRTVATVEDNIPAVKREYLNTYKCMYCGKIKQQTTYIKTRD